LSGAAAARSPQASALQTEARARRRAIPEPRWPRAEEPPLCNSAWRSPKQRLPRTPPSARPPDVLEATPTHPRREGGKASHSRPHLIRRPPRRPPPPPPLRQHRRAPPRTRPPTAAKKGFGESPRALPHSAWAWSTCFRTHLAVHVHGVAQVRDAALVGLAAHAAVNATRLGDLIPVGAGRGERRGGVVGGEYHSAHAVRRCAATYIFTSHASSWLQ
jgi:hypothetical protein